MITYLPPDYVNCRNLRLAVDEDDLKWSTKKNAIIKTVP